MRKIVKNTSSGQRAQQLINPTKDQKGALQRRAVRSGYWDHGKYFIKKSFRDGTATTARRFEGLGFRVVRNR